MDPQHPKDNADHDQMWSNLRDLLPEIERLAQGDFEGTERERQMAQLLASRAITSGSRSMAN